ncbi:MAG: PEP-CTERM sorting domain-containing protein [Microcystis aeruginosa Ma_OC_H_19870700_S124]|uniref:PEP-CTERM sorting domain-containing protein n=1 Tax=Microcystis aeruginosa Ma_OC_H_19870700_S124 TaxID=2486262 RepID=A0A552AET2_MICAE|nr:MAG: PEP-CTERM sorting domain-containing protein [Microcystis aeruginosa Ma_OC_H_19870700_S124]
MNVANGFSTGFSFFYSAPVQPGVVRIYDGLNATGNLLGSINLPLTPNGASVPGCNSNNFCPFVPIGLAFNGIAKSVDFGGAVNQIVFDDIKITLAPTTTVPEPTSVMGLIAISALGAGSVLQRKLLK